MRRSWSLRTRLFAAIGAIVALSVAITLALGLVLTRRAVDDATLKDLDHQAALIVGEERSALSPLTHLPQLRPYLAAQHERYLLDPKVLSAEAQAELGRARSVTGLDHDRRDRLLLRGPPGRLRPGVHPAPPEEPDGHALDALRGGDRDRGPHGRPARGDRGVRARAPDRPARRPGRGGESRPGRGKHPAPVPVEGAAELATLAVSFNDLAEQLARAREAERSFLLSVSHELKTPLTAIAGYAEALREGVVTAQDAADTIIVEAERLGRLVGDLLDLARMNRTDFAIHLAEVDLAEIAARRRPPLRVAGCGVRDHALGGLGRGCRTCGRRRRPRAPGRLEPASRTRCASRRRAARYGWSPSRGRCASRTPAPALAPTTAPTRSSASTSTRVTAASGRSARASAWRSSRS